MTETTETPEQVPVANLLRDTLLSYLVTTAPDPAEALFEEAPPADASAEWQAAAAVRAKAWSMHLFRVASDITDAAWWWQRAPRLRIGSGTDHALTERWLRDMTRTGLSNGESLEDQGRKVNAMYPDVARKLAADAIDDDLRAELMKIANDVDDDA